MGKDQDLLEAARTGNVPMIEKLLSARPKNVLSQAIAIGFRRSVAPNCQDGSGYTPLHHAVLNGHKLAVEILLKYDAAPGMPDSKGSTPFHLAAWTGNVEIIHILMNHPRSYSQVNEQNNDWDTPLHFAAQYGHTDVVSTLLDNGADPTIYNKKEETPLDLAAQYGRLETAELLLHRRPELLAKISPQRSILHLASRNGHPQVIKALLEAGCDINKKLKTGSALHEAALFGKVEAVRVLLQNEPPISLHIKDVAGETALQKVEGYPSKVAIEIAAMIKAFMKGDPLPPSMATPTPLRKTNPPIDAEQRSTYDNIPTTDTVVPLKHPRTPPTPVAAAMAMRHSAYTPPLTKKQGRQYRPSQGAAPRNTNYQNLEIPAKVPPRKPARSSIGILLMDKVDLSSSPKAESPLVNSSTSMFELSSMQQTKPTPQLRSPDKSPPPLPDRNYYDEDLAGEYTELRVSAIKKNLPPDTTSVPSKNKMSSFKCPAPPKFTPPGSEVQLRARSAKQRTVYASNPTDEPFMSSKEDVNEVRKSLLLDQLPCTTQAPTQSPVPAPRQPLSVTPQHSASVTPRQSVSVTPLQSASVTPRQSASVTPRQSESVYEDLSEAYSGNVMSKQSHTSVEHKLRPEEVMRNCNTIGSSTGSDLDIDVYELLSEAVTGQNDDYDIPPPRLSHSSDEPGEQRQLEREIPIPPPRRSKQGSSTNSHPRVPASQKDLNGSYPLPISATNSYYSDFPSSETDDSDMPSSPGSYYSQLPTPDHPPPSPHTAMLGIQAKLSPQSFPLHGTPRRDSSNEAWMQPTSPDHTSAFISLSVGGQRTTQTADLSESNLYLHSKESTQICLVPGSNHESCELPHRGRYEKNANARKYHHPEKPNRFANQTSSNGSAVSQRTPTNHQSSRYNAHGRRFNDREPVNGQHYQHSERYSDGYQANDEFVSTTDTSSNGDTELLRPDEEDPFAGLIYGSNRGSRNLSLENSSRFSFSHMADWSLASSTRTSMLMENGLLDVHVPDGGSRGHHEKGSDETGIDEKSEWAQIESIMASFGAGLVRESVYIRDFQKEFEKMFEGPLRPQSVGAWLENLGMGQYENMMIANGFDNLDFMGGHILEENDLIEMGIMEELHRKIILQATNALPVMKTVDFKSHTSNSVSEWLRSLLLSDCIPNFIDNGIGTMERAGELWEVELENVLEVHMLGHRKRILASLGDRRRSFSSSSSSIPRPNSLELTTSDLEINLTSFEQRKQLSSTASEQSASLDIDLFKDYSKEVTTPTKPRNFQTSLSVEQGRAKHSPSRAGEENGQRAKRQISTVEDYDNMATTRRGSGSEDGEENTPTVQWMHPPEALIKGCCNYTASYLGSTLVKEVKGVDSTQESCTKLRRSASHLQKIPSITLSISYVGVKFIDFKSKLIITEHEICNISCVTQDSDDLRTFAYITKDSENEKLYCHVFSVKGEETSTEIILTLGQAFEIAYQMLLKSRPLSNEVNRHPSNTSEIEHDTKL